MTSSSKFSHECIYVVYVVNMESHADASLCSCCTLQAFLCLIDQINFQVEVVVDGEKEAGTESGKNGSDMKVLPPWMIKDGMNLTKEQRGETSKESKFDEKSEAKDDKKQDSKDDQIIQVSLAMNINWIMRQRMHYYKMFILINFYLRRNT